MESQFNLLEQDMIIASYEKNLADKESLLEDKQKEAQDITEKCDILNEQIGDMIKKLIDT